MQEGAYLYENSVDPYQGDVFHENPLVLVGANFLLKNLPVIYISIIFILLDLLTAVFIYYAAKAITKKNVSQLSVWLEFVINFNPFSSSNNDLNHRSSQKKRRRFKFKRQTSMRSLSTALSRICSTLTLSWIALEWRRPFGATSCCRWCCWHLLKRWSFSAW